jgi:hypothetical protein
MKQTKWYRKDNKRLAEPILTRFMAGCGSLVDLRTKDSEVFVGFNH